jgi:L-asparaginase II
VLPENPSAGLPEDVPLVAVRRGALVESVHRGRIAVCDPDGELIEAMGDPGGYVYARSSAKPFQAMPLLLSGAADAFGLTDEELAVVCASHNAEEPHLAAVRSILRKAGLSEEDLQCGAHPPMYGPAAEELARRGEEPRRVHGNCSGKHAGMLTLCAYEGWETASYRDPDHPLQWRILQTVAQICGLERDAIPLAGDGCGVPSIGMPLRNLATGVARLATGENLSDDLIEAARRIRRAMRGHPYMVAGTGRLDTTVMRGTDLIAKGGAEGVFAAGSPDGWGLALKISDGTARAVSPAGLAALARQGVEVPQTPESHPVHDLHGASVGRIEPLL